jgi:hypothetical protein
MYSLQKSTHSLQMKMLAGPDINIVTWRWDLKQKEQ